eukprot:8106312-Pyramimonas_sp.AAC.1
MAPVGRRDEQRTKWCCKWCKGRDGKPFVNYPDKLACHSCAMPKAVAFKGKPAPKTNVPSTRSGPKPPGSAGGKPLEKQLLA